MLYGESLPRHLLGEPYHVQGTQGLGTTQLDDRVPRLIVVQRGDRELCHVPKRDPADLVLAATIDLGFRVWCVEAQCRTQPHLGEEGGPKDREGHPARSEERRVGKG